MIKSKIENAINESFKVSYVSLVNESHMHSGNAAESHFKLTLVSDDFVGLSKVKRHQSVYRVLYETMPLFHALAMHLYTRKEWEELMEVPESPKCAGS